MIFNGDRIFYDIHNKKRKVITVKDETNQIYCYSQENNTFACYRPYTSDFEEILCNYTGIHSYHLHQKLNTLFLFFENNGSNNVDDRFIAKNTYNIQITVLPVQKDEECIISPSGAYALKYSKKDGTNVQLLDMSDKQNQNHWTKINISLKLFNGKANIRFSPDENMILFIDSSSDFLRNYFIKTGETKLITGSILAFELHKAENIIYWVHSFYENKKFTIYNLDTSQIIYQKELLTEKDELGNFLSQIKINEDKNLLLLPYGPRLALLIDTFTGKEIKTCDKKMQFNNGILIDINTHEKYRLKYHEHQNPISLKYHEHQNPIIGYLTDQNNDIPTQQSTVKKEISKNPMNESWKKSMASILNILQYFVSKPINIILALLCLGCLSPTLWSYYHTYTNA